jgi:hypothetical protein
VCGVSHESISSFWQGDSLAELGIQQTPSGSSMKQEMQEEMMNWFGEGGN